MREPLRLTADEIRGLAPCPHCEAPIDEPCNNVERAKQRGRTHITDNHNERVKAARRVTSAANRARERPNG